MAAKQKPFYLINNEVRANAMQFISKLAIDSNDPYVVIIKRGDESRSDKQNRLAFMWYDILGAMTGNGKQYERQRCKLHYGIPIMRREDADFRAFYNRSLLHLPYEAKLQAMEYVPVTSLMTVHQFAEYLTTLDQESVKQGHVLPHPEDIYYAALMQEMNR